METPKASTRPQLLGVPAAASALALSERATWRLIARGELAAVKVGRRTLIDERDIAKFVARHRVEVAK